MWIFNDLNEFTQRFHDEKRWQRTREALELAKASFEATSEQKCSGRKLAESVMYSVGDSLTYLLAHNDCAEFGQWQSNRRYHSLVYLHRGKIQIEWQDSNDSGGFRILNAYSDLSDRELYQPVVESTSKQAKNSFRVQSQILAPGQLGLVEVGEIYRIVPVTSAAQALPESERNFANFHAVFLRVSVEGFSFPNK